MTRRDLLTMALKGTGVVVAGTVGVPAIIGTMNPVLQSYPEAWTPLGPLDQFPIGEMKSAVASVQATKGPLELEKSVYVWRSREDSLVVFSRSCTDLGCPVNYDSGSRCFFCPCHGGIFSQTGERMAGPPKRPLWRYAARIRDGILEIDLRSVPPVA